MSGRISRYFSIEFGNNIFSFLFLAGTSSHQNHQGGDENFVEIFNSGDVQVDPQGSLVIHEAAGHHVGRYLCQGANGVGQPLQVIGKYIVLPFLNFRANNSVGCVKCVKSLKFHDCC